MAYLFWSPTRTINFDTCLRLTGIKSVRSISYDGFVLSAMVFNLQILVS